MTSSTRYAPPPYTTTLPDGVGDPGADIGPTPPDEAVDGKAPGQWPYALGNGLGIGGEGAVTMQFWDSPWVKALTQNETVDQQYMWRTILNPYIEGMFALSQGSVNIVNGLQNAVVGFANFGLKSTIPGIFGIEIPTIDWSKGMFSPESDNAHWWSSKIGGESAFMLLTVGIGELTNLARFASCFPAGTPVATADGLRTIESIKAGEYVWAYDLVESGWRLCMVMRTFHRDYHGHSTFVTIAGETIESTLLHPYWVVSGEDLESRPRRPHLPDVPDGATTPGRWVDAGDLRIGDKLLLRDGRIVPIDGVRTAPYHGMVYNVAVAELACYAVGQHAVLVHNTNGAELFVNQMPLLLESELAEAGSVGARVIRFGEAGTEAIVNSGTIKFVLTQEGELLIMPKFVNGVEVSHAVMDGGRAVLTAGEADIAAESGLFYLVDIVHHSGHYLPSLGSLQKAISSLRQLGVYFLS